jgi:hypothetical protein
VLSKAPSPEHVQLQRQHEMEVSCQFRAPDALPLGKEPRYAQWVGGWAYNSAGLDVVATATATTSSKYHSYNPYLLILTSFGSIQAHGRIDITAKSDYRICVYLATLY